MVYTKLKHSIVRVAIELYNRLYIRRESYLPVFGDKLAMKAVYYGFWQNKEAIKVKMTLKEVYL